LIVDRLKKWQRGEEEKRLRSISAFLTPWLLNLTAALELNVLFIGNHLNS
jgi:hypothetical protein